MLSIQRLFRRIVIIAGTSAFVVLTIASYFQYHDILVQNMQEAAVLQGQSEAGRFGAALNQAISMAVQLSTETEVRKEINLDEFQKLAVRLLEDSPLVNGAGVWLGPYEMSSSRYYNSFYVHRDRDGKIVPDPYYNSPDYDYFSWNWWLEAQKSGHSAVWTAPYYDPPSDEYLVTASFPIIRDGRQIGISTVDISLSYVSRYLEDLPLGEQGYALIINGNGDYLRDPRTGYSLSYASSRLLFSAMEKAHTAEGSGSALLSLDDQDCWVVFAPVAGTEYTMILARPMEQINLQCIPVIARNALLYLMALVIVIIVSDRFTRRRMVVPLRETTRMVRQIADGQFAGDISQAPPLPREINSLLKSVYHMRAEIGRLLDEQKEQNRSISAQKQEMQMLYDELQESYEESQTIASELSATHLSLLAVNSRLMESQKRLEMTVWGAGAGLWDWIINDGIILIDNRYREIIGYPPEQRNMTYFYPDYDHSEDNNTWGIIAQGIHPEDWPFVKSMLVRVFKSPEANYTCEYRRRHHDGHWIWVQDNGYVMERNEQGRVLRVVGMIQDISERKSAVEALIRSTSLYKGIFNATENGVAVFNAADYRIIEANKEIESISGYSRAELINRKCTDFMTKDPQLNTLCVQNRIDELCNNKICTFETHGKTRDGKSIPLMISLNLVPLEQQLLVLAVVNDLTENIKRKEEMVKYERYKSEFEKIKALSIMSAGIVHEISQPVATIRLIAEGLTYLDSSGRTVTIEDSLQGLNTISGQCERIEKIVASLRSLVNSFEERDNHYSDINLAIENVLKGLVNRIKEQGVAVAWETGKDPRTVAGSQIEHELIMTNLMNNALDALQFSGQDAPAITIRTEEVKDAIIISVIDNGPGMAEEISGHIWEPFFNTRKSRQGMGMGMGMGLALVRTIVTRLKGHVRSGNNADGGTIFEVELPLGTEF